jgi:hypothetical protein
MTAPAPNIPHCPKCGSGMSTPIANRNRWACINARCPNFQKLFVR